MFARKQRGKIMQKKRVVVKVGSAILVENQLINKTRMEALVKLNAKLRDK